MTARAMILTLALGTLFLTGCRNRQYRPAPRPCAPPSGMAIPPQNIPDGPPPLPAPPGTPRGSSPEPPAAELLLPQDPPKTRSEKPVPDPKQPRGAILGDPDYVDPPKEAVKPEVPPEDPPKVVKPMMPEEAKGIAGFAEVRQGVTTGRRPEIEGLDWLQAKGYKTVLHLKKPGDDDTTDRRQVEKRDMKYVALEISPEKLTKDWLFEFNLLLADSESRPLFVYAGDPTTAYAAWYLHLRTADFQTHDEARLRAARFGTKDEASAIFQAALKLVPMQ